jgi:Peptidase family S41
MFNIFGKLPACICAAIIALAGVPATASGQGGPPPDPASVAMTESENREVILSLATALRERFAFRERGMAAALEIEAMEKAGEFRDAANAAELLDRIKNKITPIVNDRHFRVRYMGPEFTAGFREGPPSDEEMAVFHEELRLRGGEIPDVRWLPGNVGYLRITLFFDAPPVTEKLADAFSMLEDTSALIIDVRGTPGGEPGGVANVIGHLVAERTPTVHTEDPVDPALSRTFYAEPKLPAYTDKPVFVLTNKNTGSGAEEFSLDLQAMGRATLVGHTTSGAATPGGYRPLAGGFVAFIPMQIVTNTVTGGNWEGTGVRPDVEVPPEDALTEAHRLALEAILETATGVRRAIAEEGLASLEEAKAE